MKFFQARKQAYHTDARLLDEVIYTPYSYESNPAKQPAVAGKSHVGDLLGVPELRIRDEDGALQISDNAPTKKRKKFDSGGGQHAEIYMFEYGVVVIWGMSESEEKRFLSSMWVFCELIGVVSLTRSVNRKRFEVEKLST